MAWRLGKRQISKRRSGLKLDLDRMDPGGVSEFVPPHLTPSPLPGVHSLRVARGKKVGEAEPSGPGRRGQREGETLSPLTPYSLPQKYFIVMQSVFYPTGRISER